jgi:hypothetical protein
MMRLRWAEWGAKFVEKPAAKDVQVQVVDDLPCIDALVQGNPVAAFGYSGLARYSRSDSQQVAEKLFVLFIGSGEIGDVFTWDY